MDSRSTSFSGSSNWWFKAREDPQPKQIFIPLAVTISFASVIGITLIFGIRAWLGKKVQGIWEDEVWDAARSEEQHSDDTEECLPESTAWMNGLLASVWPLINPDLFASVVDMLEDVMQASLPKVIRMVSVDDLGQGSESIRILGIRSLPTGGAGQSVDEKMQTIEQHQERAKKKIMRIKSRGRMNQLIQKRRNNKTSKRNKNNKPFVKEWKQSRATSSIWNSRLHIEPVHQESP
jgi:Ca2+-dependent lipid-binding protein